MLLGMTLTAIFLNFEFFLKRVYCKSQRKYENKKILKFFLFIFIHSFFQINSLYLEK